MTSAPKKRKPSQKGVEAVFTSANDWKRGAQGFAGIAAVGIGATLWVGSLRAANGFVSADGLQGLGSSSLVLVSAGMVSVMVGVGVLSYRLATRNTMRENQRLESVVSRLESLVEPKPDSFGPTLEARRNAKQLPVASKVSKTLVAAIVEGLLLVGIYWGLVTEYKSNVHMQEWVSANIAMGGFFLNDTTLVVMSAGLFGFLIFQFHPEQRLRALRRK